MKQKKQLDANEEQEVQDAVFERFAAYVYLQNADPAKYGSLNTLLTTHKSLKNNQYPATVVAVNDILSQHKFDTPQQHGSGSHRGDKQDKPNEDGEKDDVMKLAFVQMIGKCYCCGSPDHKSPECPHKNKPKVQWAINQSNIVTDMTQPSVNGGNNNQRGAPRQHGRGHIFSLQKQVYGERWKIGSYWIHNQVQLYFVTVHM